MDDKSRVRENFTSYFPDELVVEIFGYLDSKTLIQLMMVQTGWRRIARDNVLWKIKYQEDYDAIYRYIVAQKPGTDYIGVNNEIDYYNLYWQSFKLQRKTPNFDMTLAVMQTIISVAIDGGLLEANAKVYYRLFKYCSRRLIEVANQSVQDSFVHLFGEIMRSDDVKLIGLLSVVLMRYSSYKNRVLRYIFGLNSVNTFEIDQAIYCLSMRDMVFSSNEWLLLTEVVMSVASNIVALDISGSKLNKDGLSLLLLAGAGSFRQLRAIDLSRCNIGRSNITVLIDSINTDGVKLAHLSLRENYIGSDQCKLLAHAFASQHCKLEYLDISATLDAQHEFYNGHYTEANRRIFAMLPLQLKYLAVGGKNFYKKERAYDMIDGLSHLKNLIWFDCVDCGLREHAMQDLCKYFGDNYRRIRRLDLNGNPVGYKGVIAIRDILHSQNSRLQYLHVDATVQQQEMFKSFSALYEGSGSANDKLRMLSLSNMRLGTYDLRKLLQYLYDHYSKLTEVVLHGNMFAEESSAAIGKLVTKASGQLLKLDLCKNCMDLEGLNNLLSALGRPNSKVEVLALCAIRYDRYSLQKLSDLLSAPQNNLRDIFLSSKKTCSIKRVMMDFFACFQSENCKITRFALRNFRIGFSVTTSLANSILTKQVPLLSFGLHKCVLESYTFSVLLDMLVSERSKIVAFDYIDNSIFCSESVSQVILRSQAPYSFFDFTGSSIVSNEQRLARAIVEAKHKGGRAVEVVGVEGLARNLFLAEKKYIVEEASKSVSADGVGMQRG